MVMNYMKNTDIAGDRILLVPEVLEMLPLSRTTLWRLEKQGLFPMHFRIGGRKIGWMESEIVSWIDNVREGNYRGQG